MEGKHSAEGKYQCPGCAKRYRWGASYYYHKKSCPAVAQLEAEGGGEGSVSTTPPGLDETGMRAVMLFQTAAKELLERQNQQQHQEVNMPEAAEEQECEDVKPKLIQESGGNLVSIHCL